MARGIPADDTERVALSGAITQAFAIAWPLLWVGALAVAGMGVLRAGGPEAPLGVVLLALPALGALVWWRWRTPLRRVVATRSGLVVSGMTSGQFIPYVAVECIRENRLSRMRVITVALREPAGGLSRFAFVPPLRWIGVNESHSVAAELGWRLERARAEAGRRDG